MSGMHTGKRGVLSPLLVKTTRLPKAFRLDDEVGCCHQEEDGQLGGRSHMFRADGKGGKWKNSGRCVGQLLLKGRCQYLSTKQTDG